MGMNILTDFFKFRKVEFGLDIPHKLLSDLNKSNEIFYSNLEDNSGILLVGMTLDDLMPFSQYLHNNH